MSSLRKMIQAARVAGMSLGLVFTVVIGSAGVGHAEPGDIERPTIIPREVWGAREPSCQWAGQDGNRVTHVVIHHTYEPTDPPSLESAYAALRHIQNLHMDDNGWCDIGYSYLVDWFGNVYEGSRGTIDRPITSAHTAGMNYEGVGIAMIGNYQVESPSAQTVAAAGRVAGWVLGWYGFEADQDVQLTVGGSNNKWASGTRVTVPSLTAHRDLVTTECPGDSGYSVLPAIKAEAATISAAMHASGDFGAGTGNSASIFAVGEPAAPLGSDAQDAATVAEDAGLELATVSEPAGELVSETAPATEPDAGGDLDEPEVVGDAPDHIPAGEATTMNLWWWAAVAAAILIGSWFWFRRFCRPTETRWEADGQSSAPTEL